jgi:hypothetical protein
VEQDPLRRLLRLVADTQDDEISCEACFALVPQYVELELAGAAVRDRLPLLSQHLDQCGVCREEYETLREFARLEAEDPRPPRDDPGGSPGPSDGPSES